MAQDGMAAPLTAMLQKASGSKGKGKQDDGPPQCILKQLEKIEITAVDAANCAKLKKIKTDGCSKEETGDINDAVAEFCKMAQDGTPLAAMLQKASGSKGKGKQDDGPPQCILEQLEKIQI